MLSVAATLRRDGFALDVAFDAAAGVTALFGPSGAGKSTVIRLVAGLEAADSARIRIDDTVLDDTAAGRHVPPHRRRVGLVFQDARLFPHLSVRANLAYGRWFTARANRRIAREPVVEVLGIGHLLDRAPATLSGGERQRVAIGRAMLASPRLLLMDEPLASLDAARRHEILPFIERLRDEFDIAILYVSHAVDEVARLAARVVRIEDGRVTAIGTPAEVLAPHAIPGRPPARDAVSLLTATAATWRADYGVTVLSHPAGEIVVPGQLAGTPQVAIRAADVALAVGPPGSLSVRTILTGNVAAITADDGPTAHVEIILRGGDRLHAYATRLAVDALGLRAGTPVSALIKAVALADSAHAAPPEA